MGNVTGDIDGRPLLMRKAYNTIVRSPAHFIGHWADVTSLVDFGQEQTLTLQLPRVGGWTAQPGFIGAGEDVAVINETVKQAQSDCEGRSSCQGITFRRPIDSPTCDATAESSATVKAYLKSNTGVAGGDDWCTYIRPPTPAGVFFENVETLFTEVLTSDPVPLAV